MQILFRITITSTLSTVYKPAEKMVDVEKLIDWPPDMRMPVKDDVIAIDGDTRAVEEVHLDPQGVGAFATVYLENFIDPDPDECAEIDFSDWTRT